MYNYWLLIIENLLQDGHLKLSMYRPGAMSSLFRRVLTIFPLLSLQSYASEKPGSHPKLSLTAALPLPATLELSLLLFLWAPFSFPSSSRTMPHRVFISCQDYGISSDSVSFSITHRGIFLKHKLHLCSGFFSGSSGPSGQGPNSLAWV